MNNAITTETTAINMNENLIRASNNNHQDNSNCIRNTYVFLLLEIATYGICYTSLSNINKNLSEKEKHTLSILLTVVVAILTISTMSYQKLTSYLDGVDENQEVASDSDTASTTSQISFLSADLPSYSNFIEQETKQNQTQFFSVSTLPPSFNSLNIDNANQNSGSEKTLEPFSYDVKESIETEISKENHSQEIILDAKELNSQSFSQLSFS